MNKFLMVFLNLFVLFSGCASAPKEDSVHQIDVSLHDGRHIKVERTVQATSLFKIRDPFFGLPFMPRTERGGDKYRLEFEHPDTRKMITWQGEPYYRPVLLDIVKGVPYLVVNGSVAKEVEAIYGCPELPYIYLKYESGFFGKWLPVPVEKAPELLRISNLPQDSRNDGGFFQPVIPRSYKEWNYVYKNEHRNERKVGDCRPPLQPLPDVPLPKPVDVELETIESIDYILKGAKAGDDGVNLQKERTGTANRANCSKFFRPPNPENLMLGERFVNDSTGNKRLPYSGPAPLPSVRMFESRFKRYCDDKFVWFIADREEVGKTVISKYTTSGDLLYNIRMDDPQTADNKLFRSMVPDSITAENGYFYFHWIQELPAPANSVMVYPRRMTKFRFREPVWRDIVK